MIGKIEKNPQLEMFKVRLKHFIKENYEFVLLSGKIDWEQVESELGSIIAATTEVRVSPVPLSVLSC
jgi:hypothetical protein